MGSIPLPALDIKPQENSLEQFGRIMQLKSMLQNQATQKQMGPLQVEATQQENQVRGQQIKDQQAMTAAMQEWDGKDVNTLIPLTVKHGASATAVMGLKEHALSQQEKFSNIAKNDAETGAKSLESLKQKNDLITGAISGVLEAPDMELPQRLTQTAQDLAQKGLLDPQHAQTAAQIAQSGDAAAIRQQLQLFAKGYMSESQAMQKAKDEADLAAKKAQLPGQVAESAQKVAGLNVPTETREMNSWLARPENKGKDAADFLVWKAHNSPTMMLMGNQLKDPQALDFAADNYRKTGQLPSGFARSPQTMSAIIARAAQLDQQAGGQGIAFNKADIEANRKSLDNLQKTYDQVSAFEGTARRNLQLLLDKAAKVPELGTRFMNTPVRMINEKLLGTKEMAEFRFALQTAQNETARVLNTANASGVLSDSARKDLENIINGNLPYSSLKGQTETALQDFDNRDLSYKMQLSDIRDRVRNAGGAAPASATPQAQPTAKPANNGFSWDKHPKVQ